MLGAQGIRATGFKRAQGNAHCAKFESHTNRVTFETNAIRMTSSVQAPNSPNSEGKRPITYAEEKGNAEIVEFLNFIAMQGHLGAVSLKKIS